MAKSEKKGRLVRLFSQPERRVGNFAMVMPRGRSALRQVKDGVEPRNLRDGWARDAYVYADEIGEVGFVMNLQANTGAQCRMIPQEFDRESREWRETDDVRVLRVHAAFVGPQGGTPELIRRGFLHLGIAGETLLLGAPTDEVDVTTGLHWEFLSSEELVAQRGGHTVRKIDGNAGEELGENTYVARIYRSHPMYSGLADSPMRRVLTICQEILTLTQMVSGIARSRLAAGILYVPEEITFASDEDPDLALDDLDEEDLIEEIDSFLKQLAEHLKAPVEDRASAAALVPLLMRGPAEMYDKIGLIEVARNLDTYAQTLRQEALARLAAGLDIDPAIIDGKAALNHWTAYNVDAEFVTKQIRPTGDLLARALTEVYLRTMLATFESMNPNEARLFRWVFDASPIMARTDEAASSRTLHDMLVLSDDSLRAGNGFDDSDKPEDEELNRRLALMMLQRDPRSMGPVVSEVLGLGNWDWDAMPDPSAQAGMPGLGGLGGSNPERGGQPFPDATSGQQEPPANPGFSALVDRLSVASDAAIDRALERAAARFVTKARRDTELRARLAKTDGPAVLLAVGPAELAATDCPPSVLLREAWDTLGQNARRWTRAHLQNNGAESMVADDQAAIASSELCQAIQTLVESSLHDSLPMQANHTRVPTELVVNALRSAGVT